ncbi:hypothetical protein CRUP_017005, partial [Coryphaenoides rupestris]
MEEELMMESDSSVEMSSPSAQVLGGACAAWATVSSALVDPGSCASEQSVSESLAVLCASGLGRHLGSWLLNTLQMRLATAVAPEFWAGLEQPENELEERDRARVLLLAFHT